MNRVGIGVLGLLLLVGCTPSLVSRAAPKAALPMARAEVMTAQSRARVERAKDRLASARLGLGEVRRTLPKAQGKALQEVQLSLDVGERLLEEELAENLILASNLKTAQDGLSLMLLEQEKLGAALDVAERRNRNYRRLKGGLALLVGGVMSWLVWRLVPGVFGLYRAWAMLGVGSGAATLVYFLL